MAILFFSGVEKVETARVLGSVPGSAGMLSFLQYSRSLFEACEACGLRMVMDSGSYTRLLSGKDIEHYAKVIAELGDRCEWYSSVDVIGNQKSSNCNYEYLLSLLPSLLHQKVLWIYQIGSPIAYLDEGLERFSRVGVGGIVRLLAQDRNSSHLLAVAERIAKRGKVKAHYFGLGQPRWLRRLSDIHEGRFSCDSSTWLVGAKYNRLIRSDGIQVPAEKTGFDFAPSEILAQNVRTMRKWVLAQDAKASTPLPQQLPLFQ